VGASLAPLGARSTSLRRALLRRGLLLGGLVLALGLGVVVSGALAADLPACPTAPDAYVGDDVVVGELRAERIDLAGSCAALAARLDGLAAHQGDPVKLSDPVTLADGSTVGVRGTVTAELTRGADKALPLWTSSADPAPPVTSTVELSSADRDQSHAQAEQLRFGLWFIAGLFVAALISPIIRRVWLP
jgi:hypothetical protein